MATRKEFNQFIINRINRYHSPVMHHCLDFNRNEPGSDYAVAMSVFKLFGEEIRRAAIDANREYDAMIASTHTVDLPLIERLRRMRYE